MNAGRTVPLAGDIAFYRRHGWWVSPRVIPPAMLDAAAEALEGFYRGERDHQLPALAISRDWTPEQGNTLRLNSYVSFQLDAVALLVRFEAIARMAARLAGTSQIRLFRDSVFFKPQSEGAARTLVGWHVDRAYWLTCTSESMLTAWIPLDDSDESTGTLSVIDGSHRWERHDDLRTFEDQDLTALAKRFRAGATPVHEVPLRVPKGAMSFHHCRTIHGSRENRSERPRVAVTVHMQDRNNRYREAWDHENKRVHHLNDFICRTTARGDPDYTDPSVFPVLWEGR